MFSRNATNNAKGVAIFCVMFFHLAQMKKIPIDGFYSFFATASVSFFLLISGYGLTKSYLKNGLDNFFVKRASAVYIPFALSSIILAAVKGFYPERFLDVMKTITFLAPSLPIDGTMWYIYFIALLYLIFYLSFLFCSRLSLHPAFGASIIFIACFFIHNNSIPDKYNTIKTLFSFHAFSFPIGVIIGLVNLNSQRSAKVYHAIAISSFVILFISLKIHPSFIKFIISSVLFGLALISFFEITKITTTTTAFLGAYSYEAYLFEGVLRYIKYSDNYFINALLFFMLVFAISFTFKVMTKEIIKNIVALRLHSN